MPVMLIPFQYLSLNGQGAQGQTMIMRSSHYHCPAGKRHHRPTGTWYGWWQSSTGPTFRNSRDLSDHQSQHFLPESSIYPCAHELPLIPPWNSPLPEYSLCEEMPPPFPYMLELISSHSSPLAYPHASIHHQVLSILLPLTFLNLSIYLYLHYHHPS